MVADALGLYMFSLFIGFCVALLLTIPYLVSKFLKI